MLPRRPACCRALQHPNQALPSSESIWISDALLFSTFQRFLVNSKGARRHGSFVPGPLESRRRMGKRRMAYRADAGTPMFGSGEPWVWMGDIKDLSRRWQAPTSSITRAAKVELIPRWLALWPYPPDIPISTELETAAGWLPEEATFGRDKLLAFQQELSRMDVDKAAICSKFNQHLKQSLKLGSVHEDVLCEFISIVTDEINSAFDDATVANTRKLAFYQTVWQGISSCQVLPLDTFRATTMNHLLENISALPVSVKMRALARDVLSTVSETQLEGMNRSIQSLTTSWSLSWVAADNKMFNVQSCNSLMLNAKTAVEASYLALLGSKHQLMRTWEKEGTVDVGSARQVIAELRKEIHVAIQRIKKCEALFYPVRLSIMDLAHTLQRVAPSALDSIIESCTHSIIQGYRQRILPSHETNIRISLLTLVSHLPNASRELFVHTWQAFDTQNWHWRVADNIGSDFILSHMVSQGFIKDPAWLRNIFEASPDGPTLKEYGFLLTSLYNQDKNWSGPLYLVQLLAALNKHLAAYQVIGRARYSGLKPPVSFIRSLLSSIAPVNARIAYSLYNLYVPHMYSREQLDLSLCPDFVISMIHDDKIEPKMIWRAMGIPLYEAVKTASRYRQSCTLSGRRCPKWISQTADRGLPRYISPPQLSPTWIALITEMASAFSVSEARPQRVALRNVSQCLSYLRRHHVPISPEISRALSYAGITREILRENWIGKERLMWVLTIVEAGEGQNVRDTVEATVELWWKKMEQLSLARRHLRLEPGASTKSVQVKEGKMAKYSPIIDAQPYMKEESSEEQMIVSSRFGASLPKDVPDPLLPRRISYMPETALPNRKEDGTHKEQHEIESSEVVMMATYTPLAPVGAQVENHVHRIPPPPAALQQIRQESKLAMQNGRADIIRQKPSPSPLAALQRVLRESKLDIQNKRED